MPGVGRRLVASVATVAVSAGAVLAAAGPAAATAPAVAQTTITVDAARPFGSLPRDFVGLSYEMRELSLGSFDARSGNLAQLFRTLGRSNLRIGGNTLDRDTLWVPAGQSPPQPLPPWVQNTVNPADIGRLGQFLAATGWKTEVGINVGRWDAELAADQSRTLFATLGRHLTAVACGNEPNAWKNHGYRPPSYGYQEYKQDFERCADVVGSNRIAGPDTSSPTSGMPKIEQFAQDEHARLAMLATHNYPLGGNATPAELLSPETGAAQLRKVASAVAAARAVNLPLRLDETNSAVGGGSVGASDTYASALWSLDYSLSMAQAGVSGLDFHGGLGVCSAPLYNGKFQHYTPICAANEADQRARIYTAAPEYYGLYLASSMGPGRFLPVTLASDRNVAAYAVRGDDGRTRLAVIQKDDTSAPAVSLAVNLGRASGTAEVIHLTGSSLGSKLGVAVQGASVDRRGHLPRRPGDRVPVRHGALSLNLAAGSAVLITLDGHCPGGATQTQPPRG
jgi:hypothetical protein